jgi:hypothetical protein
LEPYGFNAVRLPRAEIKPLQVFEENNNELTSLGDLIDLFDDSISTANVPPIACDTIVANISGQKSGDFEFTEGFSILRGILSSFGSSTAGLDSQYQNVTSFAFQYEDVLQDNVSSLNVDKFIARAKDHICCSSHIQELVNQRKIYITTAMIKSRKFTIIPKASKGYNINASLPSIQKIVGASVTVKKKSEDTSDVTFEGRIPLVFGFKATNLSFEGTYNSHHGPIHMRKR